MMKQLLVSLIVLVFVTAPASANMVVDGGFETGLVGSGHTVVTDGQTIGGWTVEASEPSGIWLIYDTVPPAFWADMFIPEGTQCLHIGESLRLNTISQRVSGFVPGGSYELSLASMEYGAYGNELGLQVYNGTTAGYDLNVTYTGSPERDPSIQNQFEYSTHQFIATGATLDLIITNEAGSGLTIDDISIVSTSPIGIVTVTLDDPCGLSVGEEGPGSDDYTVVLGRAPMADVTIELEDYSEPDQVLIVPGTLVFTAGDWDTAQTVTVTAIDDSNLEIDPHSTVISHTVESGDAGYHNMAVDNVNVKIAENDCGAWGYLAGDYNYDCGVDLGDFATISSFGELVKVAEDWLDCSWPNIGRCFNMTPEAPLAFPGAEGAGRWSKGGRGGNVIFVDNLNDSGTGSLRAACEASGPRTVVFRVSGNIELNSPIWLENPYITIAGQTAPGDGICLKGWGLRLRTSDVIVRFIRSRPGVDRTTAVTGGISGDYSRDIIIDHCSVSWASDEGISINKDADRHTVQWCIIAENLGDHGFGSILGSYAGDISYHHNLYVSNVSRMPRPAGWVDYPGKVYWEFVNNVVHNFGHTIGLNGNYGYDGDVEAGNLVGNAYTSGPDSTTGNIYHHVELYSELYASDNIYNGVQAGWTRMGYESGISEQDVRVDVPFTISGSIETESAQNVTSSVLAKVGATYPKRDSVDERLISEVIAGTGSLVADASGLVWPTLNSTTPPTDTDHDGMPDDWELEHGLDPSDPDDHSEDRNGDGYTNLEEFLNCLVM